LCTIRPQGGRTMAAKDVNERRFFADPTKWKMESVSNV
jgi:hypothetical protein